ncbi:hypothetical protein [Anatilimnocola floriformis]|uniref:hypothetical protein n=1 Tax=Anatilimnocola floriformis TaxID=2948575 RepID=UPI0020C3767A|nr:hypothetical protein [Anatilimnocola floriformis]
MPDGGAQIHAVGPCEAMANKSNFVLWPWLVGVLFPPLGILLGAIYLAQKLSPPQNPDGSNDDTTASDGSQTLKK